MLQVKTAVRFVVALRIEAANADDAYLISHSARLACTPCLHAVANSMVDNSAASPPAWIAQGHLRDDLAKQFQPHNPNSVFMCTLKKPQLGMRTETSILTKQGLWLLMSGMITWVGAETTAEVLEASDSLFWDLVSRKCRSNADAPTAEDKKRFILQFLGSAHGQRMKSISRLGQPCVDGQLPFESNAVAEIVYKFDDNMYFPWVVENIRILKEDEIANLPPFFYEYYEGCSCPRCLNKAGAVLS